MLSRRSAADLLAKMYQPGGLARLARNLGFATDPVPLDSATAQSLGVPATLQAPAVMRGNGSLRAMLLRAPAGEPMRPIITRLAQGLRTRAPHHLWLVLVARSDGEEGVIAAWDGGDGPARISALLLHPHRVVESDAETLTALSAAGDGLDALVHTRWREILGRDTLSSRFYRALERAVASLGSGARGTAPDEARRELALLLASRLLFLSFLQSKGWLDGDADFLVRRLDACLASGGDAHRRWLDPLFFGTLNTPSARRAPGARAFGRIPFLNGGLFARSPLETRYRTLRFGDAEVAALFGDVLTRYRFTAREDGAEWSEAAVDPEMLGRAFESLMASRERRDSGAYYTPSALVNRVSEAALDESLRPLRHDVRAALLRGEALPLEEGAVARRAVGKLRLLDPACGSGAFLVHLLERLAVALRAAGDLRGIAELRRDVLTRSIFGVDVNPMAVWLCELRLWLSVVIDLEVDDPMDAPPLPNLDRNVRVGDTLAAGDGCALSYRGATSALRARYARATGPRKAALARLLDDEERRAAVADADVRLDALVVERRSLVLIARGRDLFGGRRGALGSEQLRLADLRAKAKSLRSARRALAHGGALPFRFASHFADVMGSGGFDLVIGNPPWVRLHRIPAARREAFRAEFRTFRDAAWRRGARDAGAGMGFAAQVDLAALFAERGMELVRHDGVLALLLPVKLWRSLAGGGIRRLLAEQNRLCVIEDWSESPSAFDAAVYPSIVVALRTEGPPNVRPPTRSMSDEPAQDEPAQDEPAQDEPAQDEPAQDEPAQDEPAQDEPAGDEPAPSGAIAAAGMLSVSEQGPGRVRVALHRRDWTISWPVPRSGLALDESPGAPWLILPPDARRVFDRLADAGSPLFETALGRPTLGVKCGCNAAFLVHVQGRDNGTARISSDDRRGVIEAAMLRPALRGEAVRPWRPVASDERIIWTHDPMGRPLRDLPPLTASWMGKWRRALSSRSDARAGSAWWSVYRLEGASPHRPRVVWADVGRRPRACILPAGSPWVPLNTCYVVTCNDDVDAAAFAALLNSPLAASWLDALAEPARGGFRRFLAWTVARLPIPSDWARAREILAPLGERGVAGDAVRDDELLDGAARAYRLRTSAVRPLVEWTWR